MKSLVTGLLSHHIRDIGNAHTQDTKAISYAIEMCSYPDWPRKSVSLTNTNRKSLLSIKHKHMFIANAK